MFRLTIAAAFGGTLLLLAAVAGPAMASDNRVQPVRLRDNCDPNNFPPGLCASTSTGNIGITQLLNFVKANAQDVLKSRNALGWRFAPDAAGVKAGTAFEVTNQGGEVHTFTDVTKDGFKTGGCVTLLNQLLGLQPNSICQGVDETSPNFGALLGANGAVPPGVTRAFPLGNRTGTVLYQCLIHPWMRMSVTVEPAT